MPKILLVEDNEMNRDMLSRRLTRKGFSMIIAVDGGEGIAMARAEKPDLILMDMSLPVLDGWEATRQLKADAATSSIPIVPLTAHAMAADRERAMECGADDYDTKPVELDRLLTKSQRILPSSRPPAHGVCAALDTRSPKPNVVGSNPAWPAIAKPHHDGKSGRLFRSDG